ncbi:cellulase-like protein [Fibrobacter succinogenes subsp. succinogenes S85]|uniref:Cellulase-like protein n=1 Tax=Fibrobacter succinogenes (strain ATCC 19169 / S85) TaxID=59374 RepID=C9RKK7_FIBSS|nr:glycoside hydrolase family 44 protein [Fibrobacter succinogenes]ACX73935.1 glycoside hydrolase family 44 domain protein [Fibrobacter succinogenes subsp. succinogenes S85]ADL25160.1 cellulase-like protein [Fibrobacter succinogenes subsp. succinogenes S85]
MGYSNFFTVAAFGTLFAISPTLAIDITVDANAGIKKISPYLYGRNIDKISDGDAEVTEEESAFINQMLEAGIHMLRANNGNNATRYNWRHKMTVHPDWYNNVYSHDWAITAQKVLDKMPGVDAMYAFQLTGYAASSTDYNFPDWNWKQEHGTYATQTFDLAGGGEVSEDGKTLIKAGDPSLYNMEWPADSTVAIIPHWKDELKFDMSRFKYWSMDNEMEIWRGTHNDLDLPVTGDFLVERYIDVAKKARAAWGDIKLTGPVAANEWQWCSVSSYNKEDRPKGEDRNYCWLEYFIMKVAEEQKKSGVRLLDVFDIHWYPTEKDYESRVNWHRVLFDTTYNYPGANGIKMVGGNWDNKVTKEYIFVRINQWLEKYFGKDHGITLGITETSIIDNDPMVTALTYASFLGTMQDNGVEIFTPWTWGDGMYETVHLFSRYGHPNRVQSTSSNDSLVSAYSSISNKGDSLTVIFVNRAEKDAQEINLDLANFASDGTVKTLTLQNLQGETFVSHTSNALKENAVEANAQGGTTTATGYSINRFKMTLPAKSITAVLLTTTTPKQIDAIAPTRSTLSGNLLHQENGNWFIDNGSGKVRRINVFNSLGQSVLRIQQPARGNFRIASEVLSKGNFIVRIETASGTQMQKITVK